MKGAVCIAVARRPRRNMSRPRASSCRDLRTAGLDDIVMPTAFPPCAGVFLDRLGVSGERPEGNRPERCKEGRGSKHVKSFRGLKSAFVSEIRRRSEALPEFEGGAGRTLGLDWRIIPLRLSGVTEAVSLLLTHRPHVLGPGPRPLFARIVPAPHLAPV